MWDKILIGLKDGKSPHRTINSLHTEMLVNFECDTVSSPDLVYYPNSDEIGIMVDGKPGIFYQNNTNVDYFEGE